MYDYSAKIHICNLKMQVLNINTSSCVIRILTEKGALKWKNQTAKVPPPPFWTIVGSV